MIDERWHGPVVAIVVGRSIVTADDHPHRVTTATAKPATVARRAEVVDFFQRCFLSDLKHQLGKSRA
jgi:hypothetical protein